MNHCRRCDSDYEKPGTCNCYALMPAPFPYVHPPVAPYVPYVPALPYEHPYTSPPQPWKPTIWWSVGNDPSIGGTTSGPTYVPSNVTTLEAAARWGSISYTS